MSWAKVPLPRAILTSGLIVGALDAMAAMTHAFLLRGTSPDRVWKYVASGALGKAATDGGVEMVLLGLLFHFIIATGWTGLFFVVSQRVQMLTEGKIVAGLLYGIFIWLAMNFIVVPMSQIGPPVIRLTLPTVLMVLIHMFVIGLPISLLASRYWRRT